MGFFTGARIVSRTHSQTQREIVALASSLANNSCCCLSAAALLQLWLPDVSSWMLAIGHWPCAIAIDRLCTLIEAESEQYRAPPSNAIPHSVQASCNLLLYCPCFTVSLLRHVPLFPCPAALSIPLGYLRYLVSLVSDIFHILKQLSFFSYNRIVITFWLYYMWVSGMALIKHGIWYDVSSYFLLLLFSRFCFSLIFNSFRIIIYYISVLYIYVINCYLTYNNYYTYSYIHTYTEFIWFFKFENIHLTVKLITYYIIYILLIEQI